MTPDGRMLTHRMRIVLLTAISFPVLMSGCASSQKPSPTLNEQYPNLIELSAPEQENADSSILYIDSVRVISHGEKLALLIRGDLPDGCTHIGSARHTLDETGVSLALDAWRDPDLLCTQALVPFTFVYSEFDERELQSLKSVTINGTSYTLSDNRN